MSGHSKFANIKHKKEKNDAAKGKIFTKIGKELAVAVKEGGSADPANNSRLRDVIAKAKANNMPNDTIDRNIKKAEGDANAANYEHITYEGYGPNGTAIIVEALTDNRNRTATNVKNAFTKGKGNVGTPGCVSFMFDKKGQIIVDKEEFDGDSDELMMTALDAGAEDFSEEEVHCGLGKTRWEEKQTAVQVFEHIKSLFICEGIANGKNNRIRPVTIGKTFDLRDGICPACIDYSADTKAPCALELFGYQFRDNNPCAI